MRDEITPECNQGIEADQHPSAWLDRIRTLIRHVAPPVHRKGVIDLHAEFPPVRQSDPFVLVDLRGRPPTELVPLLREYLAQGYVASFADEAQAWLDTYGGGGIAG